MGLIAHMLAFGAYYTAGETPTRSQGQPRKRCCGLLGVVVLGRGCERVMMLYYRVCLLR